MASSPDTELCLEELEEGWYKVQKPHEMWYRQVESLPCSITCSGVLEHGKKPDIMPSYKCGATKASRFPMPCGLILCQICISTKELPYAERQIRWREVENERNLKSATALIR